MCSSDAASERVYAALLQPLARPRSDALEIAHAGSFPAARSADSVAIAAPERIASRACSTPRCGGGGGEKGAVVHVTGSVVLLSQRKTICLAPHARLRRYELDGCDQHPAPGKYQGTIDIEGWHDPVYHAELEITARSRAGLKRCGGDCCRTRSDNLSRLTMDKIKLIQCGVGGWKSLAD